MTAERLQALVDNLDRGAPVSRELARWFCDAVARCEGGERGALEKAMNLPPGWRRCMALQRRDDCIRRMRVEHFGNLTTYAAAKEIETQGRRYSATAWQRIGTGGAPPPNNALAVLIHAALSTGEPWPRERRIRDIIGNGAAEILP